MKKILAITMMVLSAIMVMLAAICIYMAANTSSASSADEARSQYETEEKEMAARRAALKEKEAQRQLRLFSDFSQQ